MGSNDAVPEGLDTGSSSEKTPAQPSVAALGREMQGSRVRTDKWAKWGVFFAGAGVVVALLTWAWQIQYDPPPLPPPSPTPLAVVNSPSPTEVADRFFLAAKARNLTEVDLYVCKRDNTSYEQWEDLSELLNRTAVKPEWRIGDEKILGANASVKVYMSGINSNGERHEMPDALQIALVNEQGWKVCDVYSAIE